MSGPIGSTKKKRRRRNYMEEDVYRNAAQQRPPNQENLTAEELREEFSKTLTTFDPTRPKNQIYWDFKENAFISNEEEPHYITLFSMASELVDLDLLGEGDEKPVGDLIDDVSDKEDDSAAKAVLLKASIKKEEKAPLVKIGSMLSSQKGDKDEEPEDIEEEKEEGSTAPGDAPKKLLNLFNYCERACQTELHRTREHSIQTDNPQRSNYKEACNQWIIYDAYQADVANRPAETEKRKDDVEDPDDHHAEPTEKSKEHKEHATIKKDNNEVKVPERHKAKIRKASLHATGADGGGGGEHATLLKAVDGLRFMERLIGSNVYEEVVEDFKYYEDGADEYRETSEAIFGTLLPLWKFSYEKAKKMNVTSISWSASQPDMFAVTYGSLQFTHPVRAGLVVIYTLKNATYPEFVWTAPKGAMSCDIHPERNCLVAAGLYDGNVAVLNLERDEENKSQTEILRNVPTVLKHGASVWSVKWGPDDTDGNPTFYSAGMDGKFIKWIIGHPDQQNRGGLQGSMLATFHLPTEPVPGPDGTSYQLFGCARVMAFHPKDMNRFLLGTAEGKIFMCSALSASKLNMIFDAHYLPVAALEWNHFHNDIFISCSEDWTIKIWDRSSLSPMYVFEVGIALLDVCWAPYSSTVFAAVTDEGKVLVYDLGVNKERPVCSQQVVAKKKVHPHRIQFNPIYPIIIVGDDKGGLVTLKLSPNLRTHPKDARNIFYLEGDARIEFEISKMKKLLSLVRDPDSLTKAALLEDQG